MDKFLSTLHDIKPKSKSKPKIEFSNKRSKTNHIT